MAVTTVASNSLHIVKQLMACRTLLGINDVAALFGKHPKTIYRQARSGKIPHLKFGYTYMFDPAELIELIEKHHVA